MMNLSKMISNSQHSNLNISNMNLNADQEASMMQENLLAIDNIKNNLNVSQMSGATHY